VTPLEEFASWTGGNRVYWRAPGTDALAGLGAARAVEVDGPRRFDAAAAAAAELLDEGEVAFAGFGFTDQPGSGAWAGYPSGRLVVPERVVRGSALLGAGGSGESGVLRVEDGTRALYRDAVKQAADAIDAGELAKVVVAREMDHATPLLIAEQPTRGLDIGAIEFVHGQLVEYRNQGGAVLMVSAELSEILALSTRILVMFEGSIVASLDPRRVAEPEIGLYMTGAHLEAAVA